MRPNVHATRVALLLGLWTASGCGETVYDYAEANPFAFATPLVVGSRWVLPTNGGSNLAIVERRGAAVDLQTVSFGVLTTDMQAISDTQVAMLSVDQPELLVVDVTDGSIASIALPTVYDRLTVNSDATEAIAWFSESSSGPPGSILFNPNSMTRVALDGSAAPREFVLSGPRPRRVEYAPAFALGDDTTPLELVVVSAQTAVSFVDPNTDVAADVQRLVRLADPASGAVVSPVAIAFSADDPTDPNDVVCYVLAAGVEELFAINLLPADPATGRRLQPAINQLAVSRSPASMTLFEVGGQQKLLVTSRTAAELSVVDVSTNAVQRVTLPRVLSNATPFILDDGGVRRPQAMLWSTDDSTVFFAELDTLEAQGANALRARPMAQRIASITVVGSESNPRAVARYTGGGGLSILDLALRTELPFPAQLSLGGYAIAGDAFYAGVQDSPQMAIVGLGNSVTTSQIDLPAPALSVQPLSSSNALLVTHAGNAGWLTVLALDDLAAGPLAELRGVFMTGFLDLDPRSTEVGE